MRRISVSVAKSINLIAHGIYMETIQKKLEQSHSFSIIYFGLYFCQQYTHHSTLHFGLWYVVSLRVTQVMSSVSFNLILSETMNTIFACDSWFVLLLS